MTLTPGRAAHPDGALRIQQVRKTFATPEGSAVVALDDVTLDVRPGEFFVLLGPSGCGKTTLLRGIAGLEHLDAGEIWLGERRIDPLPPYRRPVNTVFQSYALFPHLTVAQNIAFGLEMDGLPRNQIDARVAEMLRLVHLPEMGRRRPTQMSGGQQQRVALARALAKRPSVLLLDEPLAALDLKLRRGMQAELKSLQRTTGITFVFVTHDQEEALSMGDRIAVFNSGRLAQVGTPEEVYERPVDRFVADFIGETNFLELVVEGDAGGHVVRVAGGSPVRLPDDGRRAVGARVTVAVRPERIALLPVGAACDGLTTGTVTDLVYMGTDVRSEVLLGDGSRLRVRTPASAPTSHLRVGEPVAVAIEPAHLRPVADAVLAGDEAAEAPVVSPA